jgi:hypothetical protein
VIGLHLHAPSQLSGVSWRSVNQRTAVSISVIGRGDPQISETSRIPHFLDNLLLDGGETVSLTRRPLFTPQKDS